MFWNLGKSKINRERILALDLLRGTFLIEIIAFHSIWSPSLIIFITGGDRLPASAAEGFFAISGLLVGYLYAPKILSKTSTLFKKIWKRAALLYGLSVLFTFFYTGWALLEPNSAKFATMWQGDPIDFVVQTLTLQYTYGWADFLARYAVFMLFAPFAVWLVAKNKAWIVALISFAMWLIFRNADPLLPYSAWQIIFMYGIILGYYLPHIESWFRRLAKNKQRTVALAICLPAITTYIASIIIFVVLPLAQPHNVALANFNGELLAQFFQKSTLMPARIAIGVLWLSALYILFRRYEKQIARYTFGVIETLGRQSLFVYSLHAFVLFAIDLYFRPQPGTSKIINTVVTACIISIIYFAAFYRSHITTFGKKILKDKSTTQIP